MRRTLLILAAAVASAAAVLPLRATPFDPFTNSRVIVSTTLNSTLQTFDALTLEEIQPPLPSKGLGPVRLWVEEIDGHPYLFAANHGAAEGSLGVFDLADPGLMTELPLSPFPARPGPVGVVAGTLAESGIPMAFITNTWFALGGCGMPNGSVTGYDLSMLSTLGIAREVSTIELDDPIPWGVSFDADGGAAHVSSNCGDSLTAIDLTVGYNGPEMTKGSTRPAGDGADGTIYDDDTALNFTANIGASSVTAHDIAGGRTTTVEISGARPIDIALGDRWVITSNGGDDTISLIDRAAVAACIAASEATCDAEAARIGTGVPGGAPESVAYDPATERVFVVNKTIGSPSLTVIQLRDPIETSGPVGHIPLTVAGSAAAQLPALIAFDVVVQTK